MKMISKSKAILTVFVIILLTACMFPLLKNDTKIVNVNGTKQTFPMEIDENYEVINANLDEYEITVVLKNKITDEEFESTLPSEDIEDFVCNEYYKESGITNYDCSTENKIVESMIKEVSKQTIELLNDEEILNTIRDNYNEE